MNAEIIHRLEQSFTDRDLRETVNLMLEEQAKSKAAVAIIEMRLSETLDALHARGSAPHAEVVIEQRLALLERSVEDAGLIAKKK